MPHDGLQFFGTVLCKGGVVAFRYHSARGHNFYEIGAILNVFADLLPDRINAIRNAFFGKAKLWSAIVFVPVPPR